MVGKTVLFPSGYQGSNEGTARMQLDKLLIPPRKLEDFVISLEPKVSKSISCSNIFFSRPQ